MDAVQLVTILGSVVLLVGLLRAHHFVVKEFVIPEIKRAEDLEEET